MTSPPMTPFTTTTNEMNGGRDGGQAVVDGTASVSASPAAVGQKCDGQNTENYGRHRKDDEEMTTPLRTPKSVKKRAGWMGKAGVSSSGGKSDSRILGDYR